MIKKKVHYRIIPGFVDYVVGDDGSVWKGDHKMHQQPGTYGHLYVGLSLNKKRYNKTVHGLVLLAFIGPRPNGMECCHYDGNPANNRLENLRWDTPKQNSADKRRHGTIAIGSKANKSKLVEQDVVEIISKVLKGKRNRCHIARIYGVVPSTVTSIMKRNTWKHVWDEIDSKGIQSCLAIRSPSCAMRATRDDVSPGQESVIRNMEDRG